MNVGFEDIHALSRIMARYGDNWEQIFKAYQTERKPNADAISELSYRNFMEMSSLTADPKFILQKKIEKRFSRKYPEKWIPVYSRVTFSERSYVEALAYGDAQEQIMEQIMKLPDIEEIWDSELVENKILGLLRE